MRRLLALVAVALAALVAVSASQASGGALTGTTGPGFSIKLVNSKGKSVTTLKAGSYVITVHDLSKIHNFHLSGPGVNMKTSVGGTGTKTWKVTFKKGSYHYQCDVHASIMHGNFKVS
jgi:plastocyanin